MRSEEQLFLYTQNILKPPKAKTCLLDATSNSLATSIGSFLPSLKTQYKTRRHEFSQLKTKTTTLAPTNPQAKPTFNIFQFVPQIHHSPDSYDVRFQDIPRYSKRIQKIQKDSKHFEAFRVAFEPSLIPKSFFGWRNLHRSGSMLHLWTQDETWIVRKSAQPPSQRLRAKANKRRRKGPVTTFQANTPNHAVSNFQTVERQLIKIVEKGGQRSTGSKWSITETHRSASSA